MGIKGLNKLIRDNCPHVFCNAHLRQFYGSLIAVDASLYLYKFAAIAGDQWLRSFLSMIISLQKHRIKPIFIFDGEAPPEKEWEWMKRSERRNSVRRRIKRLKWAIDSCWKDENSQQVLEIFNGTLARLVRTSPMLPSSVDSLRQAREYAEIFVEHIDKLERQTVMITPEHTERLQELLDIFGLPYIQADTEGETLASYLAVHRRVSAVLSDDTDVMVYGTPVFISQLDFNTGICRVVKHDDVLKGLGLTHAQFVDLCILCGTDYNPNIPRIGPKRSYQLMKTFQSLEEIEQDGYDTSHLNYRRGRELFSVPTHITTEIERLRQPHWQEIRSFCADYDCPVNIKSIKQWWDPQKLVFK